MKKTVFNGRIIVPFIFAVLFILLGIGNLVYVDIDLAATAVMFIIAAGFLLFISLQPICFVFEKDKLTIRYFFGFHEIIYWKKVKRTVLYNARTFIPILYSRKYQFVVEGGTQGKKASFTAGEINANRRTAKYIAEFSSEGLTIEDRT